MMKHANIKQLGCLILATALLAGCAPSETSVPNRPDVEPFGRSFLIEGTGYYSNSIYGYGLKDGNVVYLLTVVVPEGQYYYPIVRFEGGEMKGYIYLNTSDYRDEKTTHGVEEHRKIADVPLRHVYFLDNDKIVFQKSYEELGIESSVLPNHDEASRKLRPILETLIREHVPPQETEMEEN